MNSCLRDLLHRVLLQLHEHDLGNAQWTLQGHADKLTGARLKLFLPSEFTSILSHHSILELSFPRCCKFFFNLCRQIRTEEVWSIIKFLEE